MPVTAIHIDVEIHRLPNAQIRQLRLLEVGIDPNIGERSQRHQPLPGKNLVAWIDIATRHDTVDVGDDIAIGKVQLGLTEIGLGLIQLGLSLFDVGCIPSDLIQDRIDIAGRVALVELREHLCGRLTE